MIRKLKNYWCEAACLCLFSLFVWMVPLWQRVKARGDMEITFFLIVFVSDVVLLYLGLRRLWRKKWRDALQILMQRVMQKALEGVSALFSRLFGRWSTGKRKKGNVLVGNAKITFAENLFEREEKKGKRARKWKHLQSGREKLGYLYRHMVTGKIRSGVQIYRYDTPCEARVRGENSEAEDALFALYADLRYDERRESDEETLERMREELHIR